MSPRNRLFVPAFAAVLMIVACEGSAPNLVLPQPPLPKDPVVVTAKTEVFDGRVTIAPAIIAESKLRELVEPMARGELATVQVQASLAAADAKKRGETLSAPYEASIEWDGVRIGTRYISAVARIEWYTGGAHPNHRFEGFVWDRLAERRLETADLLADPTVGSESMRKFANVVREAVIVMKRERLADYDPAKDEVFIGKPGEKPFLPDPASFPHVTFAAATEAQPAGGFVVHYGPYEVGSYVEGAYEVVIPADVAKTFLNPTLRPGLE